MRVIFSNPEPSEREFFEEYDVYSLVNFWTVLLYIMKTSILICCAIQVAQFEAAKSVDVLFEYYWQKNEKGVFVVTDALMYSSICTRKQLAADNFTMTIECIREDFIVASRMCKYVGWALGSLFGGVLSDLFGRRPISFYGSILWTIVSYILPFMPSIKLVQISFLVICIFSGCLISVTYVQLAEILCQKRRMLILFSTNFYYIGVILALEVVVRNLYVWQYWYIFAAFTLTLVIFGTWYTPESPRWLFSNHKVKEAYDQLEEITGLYYRVDVPPVPVVHSKTQTLIYMFVFLVKNKLKHLLIVMLLMVAASLISATSRWEVIMDDLHKTQFWILIVMVELFSGLFLVPIYLFLGKKYGLFLIYNLLIIQTFVKLIESGDGTGNIYCNIFGVLCGSAAIQLTYLYVIDLFPTFLRGTTMGIVYSVSSVGIFSASLFIDSDLDTLPLYISFLIMGIMTFSVLLLPSPGKDLPNNKLFN